MSTIPPCDVPSNALVALAKAGDHAAFQTLYNWYAPRLANSLTRQFRGQLDDLIQETFLQAWRKMDLFREGNFGAWLYRMALHRGIDERWKPRLPKVSEPEQYGTSLEAEPPEILMAHEREAKVRTCLGKLDEKSRALIESRYGGEEKHAVVCARFGLTEDGGYKVRRRALNRLRRYFGADDR